MTIELGGGVDGLVIVQLGGRKGMIMEFQMSFSRSIGCLRLCIITDDIVIIFLKRSLSVREDKFGPSSAN